MIRTNYSYSIVLKKVKFQLKSHQLMQQLAVFFLATVMMLIIPIESVLAQTADDNAMAPADETGQMGSPLKQLVMGVDPHQIQCKSGQSLVFKASNWRPACVNDSTLQALQERGWIASSEPSDEDLMKMKDEYVSTSRIKPTTEEGGVSIDENVTIEETTNTASNQTKSHNYSIDLKENVDIGAK
jgi:hypothetical protein